MHTLLLLALGCSSGVAEEYEALRAQVLAPLPEVGRDWVPDAQVRLGHAFVADAVRPAVQSAVAELAPWRRTVLGVEVKVTPKAALEALRLGPGSCPECLALDVVIAGKALVQAGGLKEEVPFTVVAGADVRLDTLQRGGRTVLTAQVVDVRKVEAKVGANRLHAPLDSALGDEVRQLLRERVRPVEVAELGGRTARGPLAPRALTVASERDGLRVDFLLPSASGARVVVTPSAPASSGWSAAVAEATLLDLARRQAFQGGEVSEGVYLDPRSLDVEGRRFSLGLRLWELRAGWWGDFTLEGPVDLEAGRLVLAVDGFDLVGASRGGDLARQVLEPWKDEVLEQLAEVTTVAVPAAFKTQAAGGALLTAVNEVQGKSRTVLVSGHGGAAQPKGPGKTGGQHGDGATQR